MHESSCVKIDPGWPLDKACLLGCGVVTGWGSAVYAGEVKPGEYVAVVGAGGIGSNAIQGARMAGARAIAAIDPVDFKLDMAKRFGATHSYKSVDEALGDHPVLTATKSLIGHLLGAAGAVESIATILAIRDGVIPPTINLDDPEEELSLDVAAHKPRQLEIPAALNNSFGFGGHNVALIFTRP